MNREERIPMKLLKTVATKVLTFFVSAFCLLLFIALLAQAISLTFYAVMFCAAISALVYLVYRSAS